MYVKQLAVFAAGLLVFFVVESCYPARVWQSQRHARFVFHLALAVFNTFFVRMAGVLLFYFVSYDYFFKNEPFGILSLLNLSSFLNYALSFILFDFFYYWWHRLNHQVKFFWRFHKVHHVDLDIDVTTSLRFHPGEIILSNIFKYLWLMLWGPSLVVFVLFEMVISFAAQFHHANVKLPIWIESLLSILIVTPSYHAAHHSINRLTNDGNFATVASFWDKLFGSYIVPQAQELQSFGINAHLDSYLSFIKTLVVPFRVQK